MELSPSRSAQIDFRPRVGGRRFAAAVVPVRPLQQASDGEHGVVDAGGARSPSWANRAGTVAMVKSPCSTRSTSSTGSASTPSPPDSPDGIGRGDGVVAGVLVVVDEQMGWVAVLAPPGGGDVVRHPALDFLGEGERRPAHVVDWILGADPGLDVHASAAGRSRADRADLVQNFVHDVGYGGPGPSRTAARGRGRCATRRDLHRRS